MNYLNGIVNKLKFFIKDKYKSYLKNKIFTETKWPFSITNQHGEIIRKRLDIFFDHLTIAESKLISDLLCEFKYYPFLDYPKLLHASILKINKAILQNKNEILLIPADIGKPGKTKGSSTLMYPLRNEVLPKWLGGLTIPIYDINSISILQSKVRSFSPTRIVIVFDDFIGSGNSMLACLNALPRHITQDQVIVVALAAQEEGIKKIERLGYTCSSAEIRKKGILENKRIKNKELAYKLMFKLENTLVNLNPSFSLGYQKSESLISMVKTPNNTFPIFWLENSNCKPPFIRKL